MIKEYFMRCIKNYFDIPHNIGKIENGKIYDEQNNIVKLEKILDKYNSIIIKPFIGGSGRSIHKIENRNKSFYFDEEKTNISKIKNIISNQEKSIITTFIDQHEYAKKLFPKTTNTIRIITIKDPETNKYIIPCAVQRIGNSKFIPVDNAGSGGYFALIDVDTGIIGEAKSYFETEIYFVHPDSKSPIKGVKIPNWNNIKESIIKVAEQFPYIHFTARDVVITKNGFSIIEGNTSIDIYLFQCFKGYRNSKLGQFYKYHNIFKNK